MACAAIVIESFLAHPSARRQRRRVGCRSHVQRAAVRGNAESAAMTRSRRSCRDCDFTLESSLPIPMVQFQVSTLGRIVPCEVSKRRRRRAARLNPCSK
jgi:hypothetical protein